MNFKSCVASLCTSFLSIFCICQTTIHADLIVNGDFETGSFTPGWNTATQPGSSGDWFVYSGTTSPLSGHTVLPPPQGQFAAITDETNRSSLVMYQDIFIPDNFNGLPLHLVIYYRNLAPFFSPNTLDYNAEPNQQARIDIMKPNSDPFSVDPNDVLANIFQTMPGDPSTLPYTTLFFNVNPFAGQFIRLRFAVVAGLNFFLFATDEVSLISTILPPSNLTGRTTKTKFVTQTHYANKIKWSPSPDPTVIGYHVYIDGVSAAFIPPGGPYEYTDEYPKKITTYYVTAITPSGESQPISITLIRKN